MQTPPTIIHSRWTAISIICLILGLALFAIACSTENKIDKARANKVAAQLEDRWGIRAKVIRVTAAGYMLDFRYRVTDSQKASALMDGQLKPHCIHVPSGKKLPVPVTKLGPMRAKATQPEENRNYAIIFHNTKGLVKKGDSVYVVIGDYRSQELVVQ